MYRKILLVGVGAAAIVGAAGTALAVTGTDGVTPGTATGTSAPGSGPHGDHGHHGKPGKLGKLGKLGMPMLLHRLEHAQIVTHGQDGSVTHDLIAGTVTSVSSTSITVKAADNTSETFVVSKDTHVRMRTDGKGAPSSIDKVAKGDQVLVGGTGTPTPTANHVIDVKK